MNLRKIFILAFLICALFKAPFALGFGQEMRSYYSSPGVTPTNYSSNVTTNYSSTTPSYYGSTTTNYYSPRQTNTSYYSSNQPTYYNNNSYTCGNISVVYVNKQN